MMHSPPARRALISLIAAAFLAIAVTFLVAPTAHAAQPAAPPAAALPAAAPSTAPPPPPNSPSYAFQQALDPSSSNVAYVFDDSLFPCGSAGCGINDTGGPGTGGSIFVNGVDGSAPGSGNTGTYTTGDGTQTVNLTNVPFSTMNSNPSALSGFDTAILYETCTIGASANANALKEINAFFNSGHKVMIFDADGCASNARGTADWSNFAIPFATNNPGPAGASGSYTKVDPSPLTTGLSVGPQPLDSVGDANIFTTFDGAWCESILGTNGNGITGIVQGYARSLTSSDGLAIYDGEDYWFTDSPSTHLQLVFDNILKQVWNPDGLPCTTRAPAGITLAPANQTINPGGTANFTATVTNTSTNAPVPGVTVTWTVVSGPDAGKSGTAPSPTNASGNTSFSYVNNGSTVGAPDIVTASFVDSSSVKHTSNPGNVNFASGGGGCGKPQVTHVFPIGDPRQEIVRVLILGRCLGGANAVNFGTTPAAGFTPVTSSAIRAIPPLHVAGTVDVTVKTPAGTSATNPKDTYTYYLPAILEIYPKHGPATGGNWVVLRGLGFSNITGVTFGGTSAPCLMKSDSIIDCTAPPHAAGPANVVVTTSAGASPPKPYKYK